MPSFGEACIEIILKLHLLLICLPATETGSISEGKPEQPAEWHMKRHVPGQCKRQTGHRQRAQAIVETFIFLFSLYFFLSLAHPAGWRVDPTGMMAKHGAWAWRCLLTGCVGVGAGTYRYMYVYRYETTHG